MIAPHDPEVTLAIALGTRPPHPDDPTEGPDQFLAEHGFEYIDGERNSSPSPSAAVHLDDDHDRDRDHDHDHDHDAAPGLSRVIDALSTIMWPSMVRTSSTAAAKRASHTPTLLDVLPSEEDGLAALLASELIENGAQTRESRMRREMAELERWLVENEDLHEREAMQDMDTDMDTDMDMDMDMGMQGDDDHARVEMQVRDQDLDQKAFHDPWTRTDLGATPHQSATPGSLSNSGFDDDFSAFISAPARPAAVPVPALIPSRNASLTVPGLTYHALPSTSDLGAEDDDALSTMATFADTDTEGYDALSDFTESRSQDFASDDGHNPPPFDFPASFDPASTPSVPEIHLPRDVPRLGAGFDLGEILSTLQSVREDVAGIGDERLRREYSARLASDFVFSRMGDDGSDIGDVDVEHKGEKHEGHVEPAH